jgi:hypothetical protein
MNLNKQQKALFDNVTNILSALVAVNIPQDILGEQMTKQISDFEAKVPDCRLRLRMGDVPRIELLDCSRDNAKTSRDAKYLTLRARILDTRLTAVVGSRDSVSSNAVIAEALRDLADMVDKMPFELSEKDSTDLLEELGIKHVSEDQEDDQEAGADVIEAQASAEVPAVIHTPSVAVATVAVANEAAPVAASVEVVAPVTSPVVATAAVADDIESDADMIANKLQVIHETPLIEAKASTVTAELQEDAPLIALVLANVDEDGVECA